MLAITGQGIEYNNQEVVLQHSKTLLELYLEYCVQFQSYIEFLFQNGNVKCERV